MEGNTTDKLCEECQESKADYLVSKCKIEVLNLHTNIYLRDTIQQVQYLCADCLANMGYCHKRK